MTDKQTDTLRAALAAPQQAAPAGQFQSRVQPWMMECFGPVIAADRTERNHRFLEEALELVQATGCTASEAHQLVDYVFGRPVGEPVQEVGGVMVTLAALCLANSIDMHDAGETELTRIWTKVDAIRAKQAAKPKHSPLPQAAPQQAAPAVASKAVLTAIRNANLQLVRTGDDEFALVTLKQAAPQQEVQEPVQWTSGPNLFKDWCAQWFGPDSDDDYLAKAVFALPPMAQRFAQPAPSGDALQLERERICAAIKAEDDYCIDQGDYMLDSDDCIKIVRGEWVRPEFAGDAARKEGK